MQGDRSESSGVLATGGPAVVAIFSALATAVQVKCSGGWRRLAVSDNTGI